MMERELTWELVPYFHGKVLDYGANPAPWFPHFIHHAAAGIRESGDLRMFADKSLDGVVSSGILNLDSWGGASATVNEFCRVVRPGGSVVVHLPRTNEANQWDIRPKTVMDLFHGAQTGWDLETLHEDLHGGLFAAFRLNTSDRHTFSYAEPRPRLTAAVVRLGAFGDLIQASSVLPWLKEQGYHVTFYCSDHGFPVIEHDPHVDRFIIQGRDEVPPNYLSEFYSYERQKYDKWINLCESVESTLLAAPGGSNYDWPNELRAKYMDRNYLEFTHELAQVPPPYRPKFYATDDERSWAAEEAAKLGRRNVLWSLSGSSVHKTWPHMDAMISRIMLAYKDVSVVLVGDEVCKILEAGWYRPDNAPKNPRVHCRSGVWSIRQSMAFAEVADLIIGPETGLLNAAGSMETPKVVTLSHSSANMLVKHWKNVIALQQPDGKGCPKQPCRQLHTTGWKHCMQEPKTGTAICQYAIDPEVMWTAIVHILSRSEARAA